MKQRKGQAKRKESRGKGRAGGRVAKRRPPRVPPPESAVWPEEYRGENWRPIYATLFAGKCLLCAHSCPLPKSRQLMDTWVAQIQSHGRYYYLGTFDDEVEAAKARDRKAWELHGEFAYLNFPEDFAHGAGRKAKATGAADASGRRQRFRRG